MELLKAYNIYKGRLIDELKQTIPVNNVYKTQVQVFDLLDAVEVSKSEFYDGLFKINRHIEQLLGIKIIFYPKNVGEK
jgi:hypothetical protein